jgi:hypothetical protein
VKFDRDVRFVAKGLIFALAATAACDAVAPTVAGASFFWR